MLDALEPAAHDQRRDQDCREGHARVAADAGELRGRGDAGELGAGGADVGHEQDDGGRGGRAMAVRSRISPASPRPVTQPIRAPSSWKTISATVDSRSTQRRR
jgi:hypothetical protein